MYFQLCFWFIFGFQLCHHYRFAPRCMCLFHKYICMYILYDLGLEHIQTYKVDFVPTHPTLLRSNGSSKELKQTYKVYKSRGAELPRKRLFLNTFKHRGRVPGTPRSIDDHHKVNFCCGQLPSVGRVPRTEQRSLMGQGKGGKGKPPRNDLPPIKVSQSNWLPVFLS